MQEQPAPKKSLLRPVLGVLVILGLLAAFAVVASGFKPWEKDLAIDRPNQLIGAPAFETKIGVEASSMQVFYTDGLTPADKTAEHFGPIRLNDLITQALKEYNNLTRWQLCPAELEAAAAVRIAMVNEAIKQKDAAAAQLHTQRAEALSGATRRWSGGADCFKGNVAARWLAFDVEVDGKWRKIAIADSAVIDPMPTAEAVNAQNLCANKTRQLRASFVAEPGPNQAVELAKLDALISLEVAMARSIC